MTEQEAEKIIKNIENELNAQFEKISDISQFNQEKVMHAFQNNRIALSDFACSSGYGYDDVGKVKLAKLFADVFKSERALVSPLITCGTHALTLALFGVLRAGDLFVSIGTCYDTLNLAISGKNVGSLADFGVKYEKIADNINFDYKKITKTIQEKQPKLVFVQRSKGYSARKDALSILEMTELFKAIRKGKADTIIMVDNCYGEFTETKEPIEIGADLIAGSLIKNPCGGLAPTGGYVAGKEDLVKLIEGRFTSPSIGAEVGSYMSSYTPYFQGFFIAPHVVSRAIKGSMLIGKVLEIKNIQTYPNPNEIPHDFIRSIEFQTEKGLVDFCRIVQKNSPIDSFLTPEPWDMPGYSDKVVMAAGAFVQGSSIEMSCDGPIRPPYIGYFQGGITYEHIRMVAKNILIEF